MARGNAAAIAALDRAIEKVRAVGSMAKDVAPRVADELRRELVRQIAAGESPDGTPWQPTKDGRKPLQNAAAGLTVRAVGTAIVARLTGPAVRHHLGTARGRIRRQILPSGRLPQRLIIAIRNVAAAHFKRVVGG